MKKFIYTITALVSFAISVNAQVGIEEDIVSDKAILDFPDNANGGIRLPYVIGLNTSSVPGTLLYDATDGRIDIVKNGFSRVELTPELKENSRIATHNVSSTNGFTELEANGVLISNITSTADPAAPGVLVLESNDRALALPKVATVDKIQSPTPGMICFDISRQALAIYNGEHWTLRN